MDARLLSLGAAANDALGEQLHLAQLYITKGKVLGKADSATREDNVVSMIHAIPGGG